MDYKTIIVTKDSGVATIRFNRPEVLNALDREMGKEIGLAVVEIREDHEVRCVILAGVGRAFCAGGDIKGMLSKFSSSSPDERRAGLKNTHRWLTELINLDKPVIASVNGFAVGAGMSLAMAADIIIAEENAKFAQSFVGIGLAPDLAGSYLLPRLVGLNKAKELTFTGEIFDAYSAQRWGIVNQVVSAEELELVTWQLALRLAQGPTKAIGLAKAMLNKSFETDLATFFDSEASYQAFCAGTEDFIEGVQAFKEKRKPKFKGK
ncbi:enoyl-CoA hydratase [Desulfosporosinus burensis]